MRLTVNGSPFETVAEATVQTLLEAMDLQGRRLAIEVNEEIVPRSEYARRRLREADRVEVVQAIGGG